jgi:prepilin-type N-terminal cleavage/methylation domain-containing protein
MNLTPSIKPPRISPKGGFTLIEIMMVVAIGLMVLSMGLPAFVRGMQKEGLRKAVSDMVEACSHARTQAILKGRPVELVIRAEDGVISVQAMQSTPKPEGGSDSPAVIGSSSTPVEGFSAQLAEDIGVKLIYVNFVDAMEFPEARVRFYPNGSCDEFTIILSAPEGERKITLDVVTALADVEVLR